MVRKFLKRMFVSRSQYRAYLQTQKIYDFGKLTESLQKHFPAMMFELIPSVNKNHSCILFFSSSAEELRILEKVIPEDVLMSIEKI